jgi:hypothetical protein
LKFFLLKTKKVVSLWSNFYKNHLKLNPMAAKKSSFPLLEPNLARRFGLTRVFQNTPLLTEWLEATGEINERDASILVESQAKLIENADSWNEEELKMQFISFIIFVAKFSNLIRTYYDREINETIDGEFLNCKSDMMLSKGIGELIETPYFFMHIYKKKVSLLGRDGREATLATRLGKCSVVCLLRKPKIKIISLFMVAMYKVGTGILVF